MLLLPWGCWCCCHEDADAAVAMRVLMLLLPWGCWCCCCHEGASGNTGTWLIKDRISGAHGGSSVMIHRAWSIHGFCFSYFLPSKQKVSWRQAYNTSAWKTEVGGSGGVWTQSRLKSEFQVTEWYPVQNGKKKKFPFGLQDPHQGANNTDLYSPLVCMHTEHINSCKGMHINRNSKKKKTLEGRFHLQ